MSARHHELRPDQAAPRLAGFRVIDVRELHEWNGPLGRIPGSEHVPLGDLDRHPEVFRGIERLLVVCRSGKRSARACERLAEVGIDAPTNLVGGMIAWNREGLPIERHRARSPEEIRAAAVAWLAQVTGVERAAAAEELGGGATAGGLPPDSLSLALERLEERLRAEGEPPDLEPTLAAFRADLAAIAESP